MRLVVKPKTFIYFELFFFLNKQWVIELFHLPAFLGRLDFIFALMLIPFTVKTIFSRVKKSDLEWVWIWLGIFTFAAIIGWMINGVSVIRAAWACITRTYTIFFFFIASAMYLNRKDVEKTFDLMFKFQILNIILTLYQRFIWGYWGDFLGGIFGTVQGCNGNTNIFILVLFTYLVVKYIQKEIKLSKLVFYSLSFVISAALSDIVAFYLEIAITLGVVFLFMKFNQKKLNFMVIGLMGIIAAVVLFAFIYPERFVFITDMNNLRKYIGIGTDYDGVYGVSRVNPFRQINQMFFKENVLHCLFGFGLGNCESSSNFSLLQSQFYQLNQDFKYYWFSHAYTYIEMGLAGILAYIYFAWKCFQTYKEFLHKKELYIWGLFGLSLLINCIFIFFYNNSLNLSSGYLMFMALAVPIIVKRNDMNQGKVKM